MYSYPPSKILSFPPLTGEINPSLSAKPAVAFPEGDASQDNTDVPQGPPIDASRSVTRLWKSVQSLVSCSVDSWKIGMLRGLAYEVSEGSLSLPKF